MEPARSSEPFSPTEFHSVLKYLVENKIKLNPNIIVPQSAGPARYRCYHNWRSSWRYFC